MVTSLDSVARHVQSSLVDATAPKYCVKYYIYFVHSLTGIPAFPGSPEATDDWPPPVDARSPSSFQRCSDASVARVAEECPELLTSFMAFIRHERSREDMIALARKMETCSCDMRDAYVDEAHNWHWLNHTVSPGVFPDPYHPRTDTLECLVRALGTILALQIEVFFKIPWENRMEGPHTSWPRFPRDIFGPNFTAAVTQCCRWLDEYPSFQLLSLIASFARPEDDSVLGTLLHSATLRRNMVQLLNFVCDALPCKPTSVNRMKWYKAPTVIMQNFISSFGYIADGVSTAYFYDEQAEPMLDAMTRVTHKLHDHLPSDAEDAIWHRTLQTHAGYIHEKLALSYDTQRFHPSIVQGSQSARLSIIHIRNKRPFETALNLLYSNATLMQSSCSNPDCTTFVGSASGRYQQCGRCSRVIYCSQSCQRHEVNCCSIPSFLS
ncbi:hypothetical protein FB45DRAFT_936455 [Roridomyces roridus]|uniref:MYND-type domain-containing protein n=1 Tax=Roridomyces roridus TaxID=1738132 RepID=A0AAD7FE80_9AGAR|nr:hypothetical protein FB45DRAFT_936455 [Roridomyces roridus]